MPGEKNSSQTRVYPAFTILKGQMKRFIDWLNETQGSMIPVSNVDWGTAIIHFADESGKGEKAIPPSGSLLKWMVDNIGQIDVLGFPRKMRVSKETKDLREKLYKREPNTLKNAYEQINMGRRRGWFALEGFSRPDVYFETNKFILVVEGKRTEPNLTENTTFFLRGRNQLIRHMDAAVDISGGKPVFGVLIYEEGAPYNLTLSRIDLENSLPHRDAKVRMVIKEHCLNPITWQAIGDKFGVCYPELSRDLG